MTPNGSKWAGPAIRVQKSPPHPPTFIVDLVHNPNLKMSKPWLLNLKDTQSTWKLEAQPIVDNPKVIFFINQKEKITKLGMYAVVFMWCIWDYTKCLNGDIIRGNISLYCGGFKIYIASLYNIRSGLQVLELFWYPLCSWNLGTTLLNFFIKYRWIVGNH